MQEQNLKNTTNGTGVLTQSIEGGKWLVAGYLAQKMVGLFSFLILARLLTPVDFGILAIVLLVPKFLQSLTETGLSMASIQKRGDITPYLNPIWTIGVIKSLIIAWMMIFLGPLIAQFFQVETARLAIQTGGVLILISNLGNIGEVYFFKNLDFKKIFIRNTTKEIIYVAVAVIIVSQHRSYWALVAAVFASYVTQTISTYILHPYRPMLTLKFNVLKNLFDYGKWVVIQGWIGQIYGLLENSIVAKWTGAVNMGFYSKAKNLASVAPGLLSAIIAPVSFPAYARIKDAQEKIKDGLLKSLHLVFFILTPIIILMIAGGGKLILILLGPQWLPMINTLRIFLIYYLAGVIVDIIYALLNGIGYPKEKTKLELIKTLTTVTFLIILTNYFGIEGAAAALLIGLLPVFLLSMKKLAKLINFTYHHLLTTTVVPVIASLIILLPGWWFKNFLLQLPSYHLILIMCLAGGLYLSIIYLAEKNGRLGPYNTLKIIIKHINL